MKYLVAKQGDCLVTRREEGTFDTLEEDNLSYFRNFAKCVGCSTLIFLGQEYVVKPNSVNIVLTTVLSAVPGVYIEGDIIPSKKLLTPYINNKIIPEHLVPVEGADGLLVPSMLLKYVVQQDEAGTEFGCPACTYKGYVVSTFPSNLPALFATDRVMVTFTKGAQGLYVSDSFDPTSIFDYVKAKHITHFVSNIELYPELSKFVHVNMDNFTLFYVLENMYEATPGVYTCDDMGYAQSWAGSTVDINKHEIR